ncbi:hypothetical protein G7054_g1412 [Neopestalotiopsis clavispora]|nr:hypothetical protein G7054_g1412 [Neopestalotiopsis clavispora]
MHHLSLIEETDSGSDSEYDDNGDVMDVEEHEEEGGGADDAKDAADAYISDDGDDDDNDGNDGNDDDGPDDADANHSCDARDADDADPFRNSNESDDSDNLDHKGEDGDVNSIVGSMDNYSDCEDRRRMREKIQLRKDLYTRELNSGFNDLRGEELKKIAMDGPARLARAANKMKQWFKRHPKHDQEQLANLLPKAEDYYENGWTDEMERDL